MANLNNLALAETLNLQRILSQQIVNSNPRQQVLLNPVYNLPLVLNCSMNPFVMNNALLLAAPKMPSLSIPNLNVSKFNMTQPPLVMHPYQNFRNNEIMLRKGNMGLTKGEIVPPKRKIFETKACVGKIYDKVDSGREFIDHVRDSDVLCGRGGKSIRHPGNLKYREIVNEMKASYRNKERRVEKAGLSRIVVQRISCYGGRFIRKDDSTQNYYVLTQEEARRKTSQALREQNDEEMVQWKKNGAGRVSAFAPQKIAEDQRVYVDKIFDLDVICGRGGQTHHHAGNKIYRKIVTECKGAYKNTKETSKKDLSQMIVDRVLNYGGRFVHRDPKGKPRYYLLTRGEARIKTSQALRDTKELQCSPVRSS